MSALLDHELPGVDTPDRAVANDRRMVSTSDALGHGRLRIVSATVQPAGIMLRPVPVALRVSDLRHAEGDNL